MLRAIIIDDERPAREVISNYLREYCPDVEVVATASSVRTGYSAIRKSSPDIVFLDIQMSDGKGFDLLAMFDRIDFKIVFVTAFSEYAIRAFRFSAVDYLLKPVRIDELVDAVAKVRAATDKGISSEIVNALMKNIRGDSTRQSSLIIPNLKGFEVLRVPEIIMCQADGYCTNFFITGQRKAISSRNLKHFEGLLADQGFLRVHHSYLVNLEYITGYTRHGEINLAEGLKAYLGDSYKAEFARRFAAK